ncbi:hypothetical protein ACQUQP_01885 [Marinobacterium sp. YM272]|uniref:hypothetical protein n=1 Tax=Marinobacterium sp. YM272 TaxID=3421654 RepID=UPI003D7F4369
MKAFSALRYRNERGHVQGELQAYLRNELHAGCAGSIAKGLKKSLVGIIPLRVAQLVAVFEAG